MSEFDPNPKNLTPTQVRAIATLIATGSIADTVQQLGISERTLRRWMELKEFRERLTLAESEAISSSIRRLGSLVEKALDVLADVMDDGTTPPGQRVRAAGLILDSTLRWRAQITIEDRVAALERRYGGRKKS